MHEAIPGKQGIDFYALNPNNDDGMLYVLWNFFKGGDQWGGGGEKICFTLKTSCLFGLFVCLFVFKGNCMGNSQIICEP